MNYGIFLFFAPPCCLPNLIPWPAIESMPLAVKVRSPIHWTTRNSLHVFISLYISFLMECLFKYFVKFLADCFPSHYWVIITFGIIWDIKPSRYDLQVKLTPWNSARVRAPNPPGSWIHILTLIPQELNQKPYLHHINTYFVWYYVLHTYFYNKVS